MYLFSFQTQCAYLRSLHPSIPVDAVEITDEQYSAIREAKSLGKVIVPDEDGSPLAVDYVLTDEELTGVRRAEILAQLAALDTAALRPLRAVASGQGTDEDAVKLADLEQQAAALRSELAGLAG